MKELEILKDQIHRIQKLTASQLGEYEKQMMLNGWSDKVINYLRKALDIREQEALDAVCKENYLVYNSEIKEIA